MEDRMITRRDFLRASAGSALAAAFDPGISGNAGAQQTSKVVLIRNRDVLGRHDRVRADILRSMLDEALATLLGGNDPLSAWRKLFKATDIVGIKSNVWGKLPTPRELEQGIRRRLLEVGVSEKNLAIDDRGVLDNPVFQKSTALINVRPVRTHHWSGVGSCLKNYIMFVPNPEAYHGEACSDLGQIWNLPLVKGKTRLNILVALTPQFYGRGAHFFDRRYVWPYKGLIVGTDPVAVDAVGAELLKRKRIAHFGEDRRLDAPPLHIITAEKKYHLGVADLSRIQIIKLGWAEGFLI